MRVPLDAKRIPVWLPLVNLLIFGLLGAGAAWCFAKAIWIAVRLWSMTR